MMRVIRPILYTEKYMLNTWMLYA